MTVANNYTALLSGQSWTGIDTSNTPTIVTYSFNSEVSDYLYWYYGEDFLDSFSAFTEIEKTLARAALSSWGSACGLVFIEVEAGAGDIQFGNYDFTQLGSDYDDTAGFAYYPLVIADSETGYFQSMLGGDVFVDVNMLSYSNDALLHVLLHETGHAIGLKHPFEDDPTVSSDHDNFSYSVMSYTSNGSSGVSLGSYDVPAVQYLYGNYLADVSQLADYSYDASTATLYQTGTMYADTIRGVYGNNIVFASLGDDVILGGFMDNLIYGEQGNDMLIANGGNNTLYGGAGNDTLVGAWNADILDGGSDDDDLYGYEGDDVLFGGQGIDYIWGDQGRDTLVGGAGDDYLEGDAGTDSVVYSLPASYYTVTQYEHGCVVVEGLEGTDVLFYVEKLVFTDQTIIVGSWTDRDFDEDGKSDILWRANDGSVAIWQMNGASLSSSDVLLVNPGNDWTVVGTADFDGDGYSDILWRHSDGSVAMWGMEGNTLSSSAVLSINPGNAWSVAAVGDFDDDGYADLLWRHDDGTLAFWGMYGSVLDSSHVLAVNPGSYWQIADSGDFNNDCKMDLLWRGQGGEVAVWLMNGASLTSGTVLSVNPGGYWTIAAVDDFDADGNADILWRNEISGDYAVWAMHGGDYLSGSFLSNNPGAAWSAAA